MSASLAKYAPTLYGVLGVGIDVSEGDLKSAFRRLAMEAHPDRNPNDPDAAERFREVTAAYDVLADAKKRALYDAFGRESLEPRFDAQAARESRDRVDVVDDGTAGDVHGELAVSPIEAARGGLRNVTLTRIAPCTRCSAAGHIVVPCEPCKGAGVVELAAPDVCVRCEGFGKIRVRETLRCPECRGARVRLGANVSPCLRCDGTGEIALEKLELCTLCGAKGQVALPEPFVCARCKGAGKINVRCPTCGGRAVGSTSWSVSVYVPPGIDAGYGIVLKGEGLVNARGEQRDVRLTVVHS